MWGKNKTKVFKEITHCELFTLFTRLEVLRWKVLHNLHYPQDLCKGHPTFAALNLKS